MRLKRAFDAIVSAALLLVLAPILGVIAAAVYLSTSRASTVLFRQPRIGFRGREIVIYKFRTMTEARDPQGSLLPDEARLTWLGRVLRRLSLDELPELVNVLRGEMSLVGPRPLLTDYRDLYTPEQWRRHDMPPGITGPVQVSGRNALSWEQKFALDLWYVDRWSLWLDLKILAQTAWKVLTGEGVSPEGHATMPRFEGTARGNRP